jgi:glutamate racemase
MRIGLLDSGTAGLALARALRPSLAGHELIFWGDSAAAPHGVRSMAALRLRLQRGLEQLSAAGAQLVAVCSSSLACAALCQPPPADGAALLDIVSEAAADAAAGRVIGLAGSRATLEAGCHARLLALRNPAARLYSVACPLLSHLVEEGWEARPETNAILKKYLHPLRMRQIDTLIPAFGVYPRLRERVQRKIGRRVRVVDPQARLAAAIVAAVARRAAVEPPPSGEGRLRVLLTEITPRVEENARLAYGGRVVLEALPG